MPKRANKKNVTLPASPSNATGELRNSVATVKMPRNPTIRIAKPVDKLSGLEASSDRDWAAAGPTATLASKESASTNVSIFLVFIALKKRHKGALGPHSKFRQDNEWHYHEEDSQNTEDGLGIVIPSEALLNFVVKRGSVGSS